MGRNVLNQQLRMIGGRATAAADQVDETLPGEFAENFLHFFRCLVVFAKRVGQPRIGVTRYERPGDAGQFLQIGSQFLRPERTVQSHHQRFGMGDRIPECFRGLARQGPTAGIGDRAGNKYGEFKPRGIEVLKDCEYRRFGVQRIEDRFNQNQVGAAIDQPGYGFGIHIDKFTETCVAKPRIVYVWRNGRCPVRRPDHAGDESGLVGCLRRYIVGDFPGKLRRREIQLVDVTFEAVIRHRDGGGIEGVGLQNINAGCQERPMDTFDHAGLRQGQQIVVSLLREGVVRKSFSPVIRLFQFAGLDHGAHGTVDHQNAVFEKRAKLFRAVGLTESRIFDRDAASEVSRFAQDFVGIDFHALDSCRWLSKLSERSWASGRTPRMWQIA